MTQTRPMPPIEIIPLPSLGPEDVLIRDDGRLLTGTADGWIYELDLEAGTSRTIVNTGGRPLGLEALPDGRVLVCDGTSGLLAIDIDEKRIEVLMTENEAGGPLFCNNADVAPDGTIYFSESSRRNTIARSLRDIIEHVPSGHLYRRHPDGMVETLARNLYFANGVCLDPAGDFVLVAETGAARIQKHLLTGPEAGRTALFTNLPGMPDNLTLGSDGLVWVAVVMPMEPSLTRIFGLPLWCRKLVTSLPDRLKPRPSRIFRVQAYDLDGTCVHDFEGSVADYYMTTGVRERDGVVYLGSISQRRIARFRL